MYRADDFLFCKYNVFVDWEEKERHREGGKESRSKREREREGGKGKKKRGGAE